MNRQDASAMNGLLRTALVTILFATLGIVGLAGNAQAGQQIFNASGTFTPAAGVTQVTVQAWGGGGAGGWSATKTTGATGGGGGGAYASSVLAVTPLTGYTVTVGAGGTCSATVQTNGGSSIFGANTVVAVGGSTPGIDIVTGGAGGAAASCTGTTRYSGGVGVTGVDNPNGYGGGGGSSAGTAANGTTGSTNTGATAPAGGGNGGNGATAAGGGGAAGLAPGGAGGGALRTGGAIGGGTGGAGRIVVNYGPTVTINQGSGQVDPTNTTPITFDVVFSEAVTGFTTADVILTGTATGRSVTGVAGSGTTYTVTVTATGGGTIVADIPAAAAVDSFGNTSFASTSTDKTVTYSTASNPTVTINQAAAQVDPTNGTILYTVIFNANAEAVTGFDATDVDLAGTAIASVTNVTLTTAPATYTVTVTGTDSGTVIATIPAGAATGTGTRLGLLSSASTSTDNTVTFDNLKPGVTIEQGGAQADPTATSPITFAVVFTEGVAGFATTDVSLAGSTAPATVTGVSGGPVSYTVTITPTGNGMVIASIPAAAAADGAGNTSNASTSVDNSVEYTGAACVDPSPSTITIAGSQTVGGLGVVLPSLYSITGNVGTFTYTINAVPVDSPWDSSAFGTTGAEVVTLVVTGTDPDCGGVLVSDTNTITVNNASLNFLMHNSQITGSTKWPIAQSGKAVNGWGIANAQYGQFECATCHTRATTNVKRIKTTLTAPTDAFPIGAGTVQLLTVADGSSQYGDDSAAGRTLGATMSNRICEGCHSKNKFHNYDSTKNVPNGGNLTHANKSDCMTCHPHKQGFKSPGCNSCHGNPPISAATVVFSPSPTGATFPDSPGAHSKHAVTKAMKCETCHTGNTMPTVSYTIQMGFTANGTNVAGFNGTVAGGAMNVPQNANLTNGYIYESGDGGATLLTPQNIDNPTCTVYCHGNWAGSNGTIASPAWVGASQAVCGACHSTSTASPPQTGSHVTHVLSTGTVKLTCNKCHPTYSDTAHLNGNVAWQLATADTRIGASAIYRTAASGSTGAKAPSATYGTCSNVYCHGANTPTWGGANINCDGCHAASSILEGNHGKHYAAATVATANVTSNDSTAGTYVFQCGTCHNATATVHAGGMVSAVQSAEISLTGGATYTAAGTAAATSPDGSFAYTNGTCGFNACHNNGKATPGAPNNIATWTGTLPTNCTGCHNNNLASTKPMNTSAHPSHVSAATVMPVQNCQLCHYATVNTTNDQVVNDKTMHVNGARDVAIEPSYDSNGATSNWDGTSCSAVYCHSNGKATPTFQTINWTTTIGCTGCHGGAGTTTTLSAAHLAHVGTDPSDTNKQFGYTCDVCHVQTASSNSAIGTVANHINKLRDVSVVAAKGGTGTIVGGDYGEDILTPRPDSCGTTNCHGTSSPGWVAGATNGDCSACHGMSDPLKTARDTNGDTTDSDFQVGAHAAHMNSLNNYSADIACDQCHNATYAEMAVQTTYVGKVNVAGHIDSILPAEVTYGSIAAAAGAPTSYVPGTGVCSNYCHGSSLANGYDINPGWDQNAYLTGTFSATGDCNRCHGCPPLITGHTGSETLDKCGQCHTATMTNGVGNAFLDVTKHVNGVVEVNTSCVTCHGQLPPNTGSHPKHGVHLVQDLLYSNGNPDGTLADWNATNYPACAVCHDMTDQAFHTPPGDPTIMGAAKPDEAFAPNYPVPGAGYPVYDKVNQTCTNARCHFKPTPDWKP